MGKKCILITTAKLNIRALFIAGDIEEGKFFTLCPRWPDTIWQFWTLSANPKYAFHNTNWQLIMCIWWLCLSSRLPIGDQEIFFNFKPSLVLACAWSWSRGGASHRTLVPLHLPLLGFCFFSFFCVCCIINVYCILQEEYRIKRWKKKNKTKQKKHTCKKVRQSYGNIAMK